MSNHADEASSVSRDAVYREVYNELRRYRDYQFTSSTWYTALLLALFGFLVVTRFGHTAPTLNFYLASSCWPKLVILIGSSLIAGVSSFLVCYTSSRYSELRRYAESLEPEWKRAAFTPRQYKFRPHHIYYATPWFIVATILVVTFFSAAPPAIVAPLPSSAAPASAVPGRR